MASHTIESFETEFLEFQGELLGFLFRLTANRQDAEDLLQDAYLRARDKLDTFQERSSLKTWVFSIAANMARDHHRVRRRWREDAQDRCRERTQADPDRVGVMQKLVKNSPADRYEFKEHIDYCFTCIAKTLELEQQVAVLLKDVYGFKVMEIVQIMDSTEGRVKHALADGRRTMTRVFDDRCVLVSKRGVCHQCSEISGFVNPKHDAQVAAAKLSMVKEAGNGSSPEKLYRLRAGLVRGIDPLTAPASSLHAYLLELDDEWPRS